MRRLRPQPVGVPVAVHAAAPAEEPAAVQVVQVVAQEPQPAVAAADVVAAEELLPKIAPAW